MLVLLKAVSELVIRSWSSQDRAVVYYASLPSMSQVRNSSMWQSRLILCDGNIREGPGCLPQTSPHASRSPSKQSWSHALSPPRHNIRFLTRLRSHAPFQAPHSSPALTSAVYIALVYQSSRLSTRTAVNLRIASRSLTESSRQGRASVEPVRRGQQGPHHLLRATSRSLKPSALEAK